ncbi:MAG: toprim domain-containing protein [Selenomonadaceae bacterium]|nr:toprim domain-containing protein [Selenomonadaceae bacterium]
MNKVFYHNEKVKADIKNTLPDTLIAYNIIETARKSGIVCPNCGNGSGEDGTGIIPSEYNGAPSYYCHKCGKHFDNFDLIAHHFNLDVKKDFPKVLAEGATLLGGVANIPVGSARVPVKKQTEKIQEDFSAFIEDAFINIGNLPIDARRSLTLKTLEHFTCGFAPSWRHPKTPNAPTSARLIVPTSKFHYLARAISPDVPKQYAKQHAGEKEIFNIEALKSDATVVVVEGEFDVMSIWQVSEGKIPVVAVSGCSNYKLLLNWLDNNPDCNIKFIVMFDNDSSANNPGQTNAKKFVDELNKRGFPAANKLLSDKMDFDANDWLQQDSQALAQRISEIFSEGSAELEMIEDKIKADAIFDKKVAAFEKTHGKIADDTLAELKEAVAFLSDISVEKITADLMNSENLHRALGLCSFYSFNNSLVSDFVKVFQNAKSVAKKSDNAELNFLTVFSLDDLRKIIKKSARLVEKSHEDFQKQLAKEKRIKESESRKLQHIQHVQENSSRLEVLKNMPQTPERDDEMIQIIRDNCDWKCNRRGEPVAVRATAANLNLIFDNDPLIQGIIGHDQFLKADVILKKLPWDKGGSRIGQLWSDIDDAYLQNYISTNYTELYYPRRYFDYLNMKAHKNSFHPVKDYFEKLPAWDGTPRAETFFVDFLGAEDLPYTREVTFVSLLAAIARIYNPGCEYQYMPIFQGNQGIGKSHILKMLGNAWYTELLDSVDDSHALDAIDGSWITEIPELHSFTRAGANSIKAFISRDTDKRRRVYARRAEAIKRSNVFFGTTNDSRPLKDFTGARRFPIIKCNNDYCTFKEGLTKNYVNQLWAELFQKYNEFVKLDGGHFNDNRLRFSRDTQNMIEQVAEDYTIDDTMVGEILEFINLPIPYQVIWNLLTKDERKKFCSEHHIYITRDELIRRQHSRKRPVEMEALMEILNRSDQNLETSIANVKIFEHGACCDALKIYGVELRDSICSAEIYNECFGFGFDQRKNINHIADILSRDLPDEWVRYGRKRCSIYGDQKSVYVRDISEIVSEPEPTVRETVEVVQVDLKPQDIPDGSNTVTESVETVQVESESQNVSDSNDSVTVSAEIHNVPYFEEEEFLTEDEINNGVEDDFYQLE